MKNKTSAAVDVLRRLPSPLFTSADAAKLIPHENVFLFRASKKGYVKRIANRVYWNALFSRTPPTVEEVACFARQPSYISCEWALNYHGIIIQSPTVCTVLTLSTAVGEARRLVWQGVGIEFSRIADRLFTGYTMQDGFTIATPEKALLDTIYLRNGLPVRDELELDVLDPLLVRKMADDFPKRVRDEVRKLLG